VTTYPFLSDDWISAAIEVRQQYQDRLTPISVPVRLNMVVTEIPHRSEDLKGHVDNSGGQAIIEYGHLDDAQATITLDYETARAGLIDNDPQMLMQAFMRGKILLEGDPLQLMALQSSPTQPDPVAEQMHAEILKITAPD